MFSESHARSIAKAASYRLLGSLLTALIIFLYTRRLPAALALGGVDLFAKLGLYFMHERLWSRIGFGRRAIEPRVIWFTGLSGSGKTTLSTQLAERLKKRGLRVEHLDGDTIRKIFPNTGFSRSDREEHVKRVGLLASYLERNGVFVVASLISPYAESRAVVRKLCQNYVEVYVSTPLEECEKRDTKGLYARARRGEIRGFTGVDDPYEVPASPEVVVDTSKSTMDQALQMILARIP